MQDNGYWKRFESTGAVGAYLDYKAQKEHAGEREEMCIRDRLM